MTRRTGVLAAALVLMACCAAAAVAQDPARPDLSGTWVANLDASEDVDAAVEKAIRARGGNPKPAPGMSRSAYGRYRGGPDNQAFYDHVAYDQRFTFTTDGALFRIVHQHPEGDLEREFGLSGGGRTVTASGARERKDYSFAYWDGDVLVVESRPRDSGRARERYRLIPETGQLEIELRLAPTEFFGVIEVLRVFDRAEPAPPG